MDNEKIKNCPFNSEKCSSSCALYINPTEMNEAVRNKLASIGIISRETGSCSFKNLSLALGRMVYEETTGLSGR